MIKGYEKNVQIKHKKNGFSIIKFVHFFLFCVLKFLDGIEEKAP